MTENSVKTRRSTPPPPPRRSTAAPERDVRTEVHTARLYVTESFFLRIDHLGYPARASWSEGAYGCVLQLESEAGLRMALKIPRLIADTVRENAFVTRMLEEEEEIVHRAYRQVDQPSGLVPLQVAHRNPLRGVRQLANQAEEVRRAQDGGVIFVSFSDKSRAPCFCSVRKTESGFEFFPVGIGGELRQAVEANWDRLVEASTAPGTDRRFQRTVFLRTREASDSVACGHLEERIVEGGDQGVWFAALPSICLDWARGTLEEVLSRAQNIRAVNGEGSPRPWSIADHYTVLQNVLRGLDNLHRRGIVHADVRPANVMCMGAFGDPESYVLGDYGSFAPSRSAVETDDEEPTPTGHTPMGPMIGNHRASIHYAPERRSGTERESADVALVFERPEVHGRPAEYFVCVGWKRDLLSEQETLPDLVRQEILARWEAMIRIEPEAEPYRSDRLCRGDRIRLREHVFTVIDGGPGPLGTECFRCETAVNRVVHERLTTRDLTCVLGDEKIITLSRYVELRKWTAATDLYGIGALALHSIFVSHARRGQASGGDDLEASVRFSRLIEYLASVNVYNELGGVLQESIALIEALMVEERPARDHADQGLDDDERRATLRSRLEHNVDVLVYCVTDAETLLECFDRNYAHFILYLHFIVSCLHRCDDASLGVGRRCETFCATRHEIARANGAAAQALRRIRRLRGLLEVPSLKALRRPSDAPDTRTPIETQTAMVTLQLRTRQLEVRTRQLEEENVRLKERAEAYHRRLSRLSEIGRAAARGSWRERRRALRALRVELSGEPGSTAAKE